MGSDGAVNPQFTITDANTPQQGQSQQADSGNGAFSVSDTPGQGQQQQSGGFLHTVGQGIRDLTEGVGAGAIETLQGGVNLAHKGIHKVLPEGVAEVLSPKSGMDAMNEGAKPLTEVHGAMQHIGYAGESLAEFLMGDEALKGVSVAQKFEQTAKIMKLLEGSPRIMKALQAGAALTKDAAALSPEEQALVKQYPKLKALIGLGIDSIRAGATQGVQTTVKTGGDVKEGAKQGAEMAALSVPLGGLAKGTGALLEKGLTKLGKGVEAGKALTAAADSAPAQEEITSKASKLVHAAEESRHTEFQKSVDKIKDAVGDAQIPLEETPLYEAVKNVTGEAASNAKPLDKAFGSEVPRSEKLKRIINALSGEEEAAAKEGAEATAAPTRDPALVDALGAPVKDAAEATAEKEPINLGIDELLQRRQQLGKAMRDLPYSDYSDRQIYRKLIDGVDDTISKLGEGTGVENELRDAVRKYRESVPVFDNPIVEKIHQGNVDEIMKLFGGNKAGENLDKLTQAVGSKNLAGIGEDLMQRMIADAKGEKNLVNAADLVKKIERVKPQVMQKLFQATPEAAKRADAILADAKNARLVARAMKAGLLTTGFGTIGHFAGPMYALVGLVAEQGGEKLGINVLNYFLDNPMLWNLVGKAAKVPVKGAAETVGKVAAKGATAAVNNSAAKDKLRKQYATTSAALAGEK